MNKSPLSPAKYVKTKGSSLKFHECYINLDWKTKGIATIFISKKMPSGNFIPALYLVDIFCLGLKNSLFHFNLGINDYNEFKEKALNYEEMEDCSIELAHNIIFGAIDYAEELGFKPQKDFSVTEYLLDHDMISDGIDEIEFGKDGQPLYIAGPEDDVNKIMNILKANVGEGNFHFMHEPQL